MELNVLGLQPRTFNCQLENIKSKKKGIHFIQLVGRPWPNFFCYPMAQDNRQSPGRLSLNITKMGLISWKLLNSAEIIWYCKNFHFQMSQKFLLSAEINIYPKVWIRRRRDHSHVKRRPGYNWVVNLHCEVFLQGGRHCPQVVCNHATPAEFLKYISLSFLLLTC